MPDEATATSYSADSFFGDIISTAKELGSSYLDFSWNKYKFDEELALSEKYKNAVNNETAAALPTPERTTADLVKYGLFGVAALVAVLVAVKVLK